MLRNSKSHEIPFVSEVAENTFIFSSLTYVIHVFLVVCPINSQVNPLKCMDQN